MVLSAATLNVKAMLLTIGSHRLADSFRPLDRLIRRSHILLGFLAGSSIDRRLSPEKYWLLTPTRKEVRPAAAGTQFKSASAV
jgi:hypothetical protein